MKRCFIFDVEATCWRQSAKRTPEIIELGGVLINSDGIELSRFHRYVQPVQHPFLSSFCSEMTGIEQSTINRAPHLDEVVADLAQWSHLHQPTYFISWGNFDIQQLQNEAAAHQISTDWFPTHINLQHEFRFLYGLENTSSVEDALKQLNLTFQGRMHSALDDALNTGRVYQMLLHKWPFL